MFILNANEPKELAAYLQQLKWLDEQETIVHCLNREKEI
jgi:5-methylthioribose kinase